MDRSNDLSVGADRQPRAVARPDGRHRPPSGVRAGRGRPGARPAARRRSPQRPSSRSGLALRTLPPILYGKAHPYGVPFSGSGDPAAVAQARPPPTSAAFHDNWLRPDDATIFVVGDTSLAQIMPLLEKSFGDWRAHGTDAGQEFRGRDRRRGPAKILLLDRPNTPQSLIFAGQLLPVQGTDDIVAADPGQRRARRLRSCRGSTPTCARPSTGPMACRASSAGRSTRFRT